MARPGTSRSTPRSSRQWILSQLEPRLMLAGDAGAAVANGPAANGPIISGTAAVELAVCDVPPDATTHSHVGLNHLVIIDAAAGEIDALIESVPAGADFAILDQTQDGIQQISSLLQTRQKLASVHLISHATEGELQLGSTAMTSQTLQDRHSEIEAWGKSFAEGGDFLLYGCDLAAGETGETFVRELATAVGVDVAASNDRTGNATSSITADWELEQHVGTIQSLAVLNQDRLKQFNGHLNIEIYAAGSTSDELMELEINGQIVDTWFVRNTDAESDQFLPYFVDIDGVSADDIRINFVNDLYDPAAGIDRNLRVDRIVVDGVTFETENSAVFSDGTWIEGAGITSGNLQSEYLNSNGYFQFSSDGASNGNTGGGNGSQVEVSLRGQTGTESAEVLLDGRVVAAYDNISTSGNVFSFEADGFVTADRVRVAFTNDNGGGDFDRNLDVDFIRIDGQTFQTEAATTFSTGTWLPADGIQDGFRQSETLHANGYFQYLAGDGGSTGSGPGQFSIQPSQITVNEGQDTVTIEVTRLGGNEGEVSVGYFTSDDSATAGQDYISQSGRLFFNDGQASAFITIDLLDDSQAEGAEAFGIVLDAPVGTNILIPRTSTVTLIDNDSFVPGTEFFDENAGIDLNGVARYVDGDLYITGNVRNQRGSAFYETPISVNNTSFQAQFDFTIGGRNGTRGGEGMTFVLQNSAEGSSAIGTNWYGLGYEGIENSLAIEIDTINNDFESGGARQISVVRDGVVRSHVATVDTDFVLNDSRNYSLWVDYNGNSDKLAIFLSDNGVKPEFATLVTTIELDDVVGDQAFVGFTASSYYYSNEHIVRNFQMTFDPPPFDPPVRPSNPDGNLVTETVVSGLNQPLAIKWADNGRNLYVAEKVGVLKVSRDGGGVQTVIDISGQVNDFNDRGLIDFAIHPDLANNPYAYLLYTYDPPEVYNHSGVAGPDGNGNRAGRLMRVTLDASTGYTSIVAGSETILLGTNSTWNNFNGFIDSTNNYSAAPAGFNSDGSSIRDFIASDSQSHTVGSVEFGIDGNLFVSIGDGAAYTQVDPRAQRVQDITNLSGKVLRIDPITGQGLSDNPFFTGNSNDNASKVFQLGLRNPWRLTVNPNSGQLFIGDTGWISYEEINTGGIGANFGWPYFEGSQGSNSRTPQYSSTSGAAAFYADNDAIAPVVAVSHSGTGDAIALGGFIDSDNALGDAFNDTYFYTNVFDGTVRYFRTDAQGQLTDNQVFTTNAQFIVDIQQGPDGSIYFANLLSGEIGRWQFV